jgi:hypothetical protein
MTWTTFLCDDPTCMDGVSFCFRGGFYYYLIGTSIWPQDGTNRSRRFLVSRTSTRTDAATARERRAAPRHSTRVAARCLIMLVAKNLRTTEEGVEGRSPPAIDAGRQVPCSANFNADGCRHTRPDVPPGSTVQSTRRLDERTLSLFVPTMP